MPLQEKGAAKLLHLRSTVKKLDTLGQKNDFLLFFLGE